MMEISSGSVQVLWERLESNVAGYVGRVRTKTRGKPYLNVKKSRVIPSNGLPLVLA